MHHLGPLVRLALVAVFYLTDTPSSGQAKILRNNALMNRMVSHFQKDNNLSLEADHKMQIEAHNRPEKVISLMQNTLCRNFPSIPCNLIMQDDTLRGLIERSIQQLNLKKLSLDKSTQPPGYELTLLPIINSEELNNFLAVSNTGYFKNSKRDIDTKRKRHNHGKVTPGSVKNFWSPEKFAHKKSKVSKLLKDAKRSDIYTGRKKMRKFYPHKIKYKDKNTKNPKQEYTGDFSEEKQSISMEMPEVSAARHQQRQLAYKVDPAEPPLWRIDYMKHGDPSINMFGYDDDRLKKIMKAGPGEDLLEQDVRKEVLHPDVYIKKNFMRKSDHNEEIIE